MNNVQNSQPSWSFQVGAHGELIPVKKEASSEDLSSRSKKRGGRKQNYYTKQGPQLPKQPETRLEKLAAYMDMLLELQLHTTSNQSKVSGSQTHVSSKMIDVAQQQLKEVIHEIHRYEEAKRKAHRWGLVSKILGGIAAALSCVLAAATGGALTFLVALSVTAMMYSGGNSKFQEALEKAGVPKEAAGLCVAAIETLATVGLCAGAGVANALSSETTTIVSEEAAEESAQVSKSTLASEVKASVLSGMKEIGPQVALLNNLGSLPAEGIVKLFHAMGVPMSKEDMEIATVVIGAVFTMGMAVYMSLGNASEAAQTGSQISKVAQKIQDLLGPERMIMMQTALNKVRTALVAGSAGAGTGAGLYALKEASSLDKMGDAKGVYTLADSLSEMTNGAIQREGESNHSLSQSFREIESDFQAFVEPEAAAARVGF